ncbi:hypothetical protein [Pseudomonas moraviensis]|uniref:hypothetical protein n=1 Tax=Pseudomonas moraviensis TaxID=321662 RepID=UPI002093CAAD|nr:hypothetical protein [Pseudomonas moraviensis]UST68625.1 hypothetical protein NF674_22755 [Pseudomonas moraviensis]
MKKRAASRSKGLTACDDALQRLLEGAPIVHSHVGLDFSKITAGVVSYEAGFDRGYLKKSRSAHLPILAKIAAIRQGGKKSTSYSVSQRQKYLDAKLLEVERRLLETISQRNLVLAQNLQLWERIKELEDAVGERKVIPIG